MDYRKKNSVNSRGWTKVYVDLLDDPDLSPEDKLVEIFLRAHTRPDRPECWPSQSTIGEWARLGNEGRVRQAIKNLERAGRLSVEPPRPGRRTCTYYLAPRSGKWVAISNQVLADEELKPRDKLIFAYILKHVPKGRRYAIVRQAELAGETGFSRRQVQESVYRLERREFLSREWHDRRKPTTYLFPPYDPPRLTGYDKASAEQREPGHQDTSLQDSDSPSLGGLRSRGGGDYRGDHDNGRRSLVGSGVHQDYGVQGGEKPSPEALDSGGPPIPPREVARLDAHRTDKDYRSENVPFMCIKGHQVRAEQNGEKTSPKASPSGRRIASSVRRGASSSGSRGSSSRSPKVDVDVVDVHVPETAATANMKKPSPQTIPREDARDYPHPRYDFDIRWSRKWGWIELRDPFTGEWHEVPAKDCPEWVRRAAGESRKRRRESNADNVYQRHRCE